MSPTEQLKYLVYSNIVHGRIAYALCHIVIFIYIFGIKVLDIGAILNSNSLPKVRTGLQISYDLGIWHLGYRLLNEIDQDVFVLISIKFTYFTRHP